jgi:flagellar export protein FliJ
MRNPYSVLLRVRQALEREAELAIAHAGRAVVVLKETLASLDSLRERWIRTVRETSGPCEEARTQVATIEAELATVSAALPGAEAALEAAQARWGERHRERRVVEEMELRVLAEQRQAVERREQTATDDLAAILRRRLAEERDEP